MTYGARGIVEANQSQAESLRRALDWMLFEAQEQGDDELDTSTIEAWVSDELDYAERDPINGDTTFEVIAEWLDEKLPDLVSQFYP